MSVYDDLLDGAIDLHCHVDLEFSETQFRKREPEWEWLPKAEALGIRGVVLKSHWWPTALVVPYLRYLYTGPVTLWSSITLNPVVGGPELWAIETAAALGASVVFLPTWGARHDLRNDGFHARVARTFKTFQPDRLTPISFLDADEGLTPSGHEVLRYCQERELTLATGHVSWQEALAFAEAAHTIGYDRLIFTHPLSGSVKAPLEVVRRAAALGAWIEVTWTNIQPGRMDPSATVRWIREVGAAQVVLSTDYFRGASPAPPELFRLLLGTLYDAGLTAAEIRQAVVSNPSRVLGLAAGSGAARARAGQTGRRDEGEWRAEAT